MLLHTAKRVLLASALCVSSFVAVACSDTIAQSEARDKATTASCDLADKCELVGEGKTYTSRDDCESTVGGIINNAWPSAECTNIKQSYLDSCVTAINNTTCGDAQDLTNTFANKCSKGDVCGAADGS